MLHVCLSSPPSNFWCSFKQLLKKLDKYVGGKENKRFRKIDRNPVRTPNNMQHSFLICCMLHTKHSNAVTAAVYEKFWLVWAHFPRHQKHTSGETRLHYSVAYATHTILHTRYFCKSKLYKQNPFTLCRHKRCKFGGSESEDYQYPQLTFLQLHASFALWSGCI